MENNTEKPALLSLQEKTETKSDFDRFLPAVPKKKPSNVERLIDKVGKAQRVLRNEEGHVIGFESFGKKNQVEEKTEKQELSETMQIIILMNALKTIYQDAVSIADKQARKSIQDTAWNALEQIKLF
jgi:hypothetical protein